MRTLIVGEVKHQTLNLSVYQLINAAKGFGLPIDLLVVGYELKTSIENLLPNLAVDSILVADSPHLIHATAKQLSDILKTLEQDYQNILAVHSTWSKAFMPYFAARLDITMVTEVIAIEDKHTYVRPIYAGNLLMEVQNLQLKQIITIRGSSFAKTFNSDGKANIKWLNVESLDEQTQLISEEFHNSDHPDLTSASVVVAGGRSFGEQFFALMEPLAITLNAAIGATRACVDAGFAPNDWQVGQTGVVVAPDVYIAIGLSGAQQHIAGMKDSKVVFAINVDINAPIFKVADYGLEADLFEVVPKLTELFSQKN